MGLFSSGGNQMNNASRKATKAIGFTPPDVALAGAGQVGFTTDKYKGITGLNITPDQQLVDIQNQLYGSGQSQVDAGLGLTGDIAASGSQLLGAGQNALSALGSFDPAALAGERYNALQAILAPQDLTNQSANESRLLAQGRLDSTGGAAQLKAYQDSLNARNAQLADQAYSESQQAQMNLGNLGIGLSQAGAQQGSGLYQQGLQGYGAGQTAMNPLYQLLNLTTGIGSMDLSGKQAKAGAINNYNAAQAQNGGGFLSNILPAVATGVGAYFGGPAGASVIGGLFGGSDTPMSSAPLTAGSTNGPQAFGNLLGGQ